jgi:hypothetical protein
MKKSTVSIILALCFTIINVIGQIPTNGLVSYYPFNGNPNDLSIALNHGVLTNGPVLTQDRFGTANAAYYFDGINDYIKLNNTNSLNTTNFSYSIWVKTDSLPMIGTAYNIFELGSSSTNNGNPYGHGFSINNNYVSTTGWRVTSNNVGAAAVGFQSGVLPTSNMWNHLVITRSDTIKMYVDGLLLAKQTTNGLLPYFSNVVNGYIGTRTTLFQFFKGTLDDICLYNRAITPAEVTALYNDGICKTNITVTDTLVINGAVINNFNPITYNNSIKIYPNPTKDHLIIDNGNLATLVGYNLNITNSLGQVVFASAITQPQFNIDLSNLTGKGMYFIHIINPQGITTDTRKIVLQ